MNADLNAFKLQIFKYTFIAAFIFGVVSLPFSGANIQYFYGLALGTCIAVANFNILMWASQRTLQSEKKWIAAAGYLFRLLLYGLVFYCSLRTGLMAALGCVLGFMTVKLALFYIYGVKTKFSKNRTVDPEVQAEFERMDQTDQTKQKEE